MGAELMVSAWRGYMRLDDLLLPNMGKKQTVLAYLSRIGKVVFLEPLLTKFVDTAQHEVFGHGARLREFNIPVTRYEVGFGTGVTVFPALKFRSKPLLSQTSVNTGGIEASRVMALVLARDWLGSQRMDVREGVLFFDANFDQIGYTYITSSSRSPFNRGGGNDIQAYVAGVNTWHNNQVVVDVDRLKGRVWIGLLDPYMIYSVFNVARYIVSGEQQWKYPMFTIGDAKYLPGLRVVYAPYGLEYQLMNYIRCHGRTIIADIRYGKTNGVTSFGIGAEIQNVVKMNQFSLGIKAHLWRQPDIKSASARVASDDYGILLAGQFELAFTKQFKAFVLVGYKSEGFVTGEVLDKNYIGRIGIQAIL